MESNSFVELSPSQFCPSDQPGTFEQQFPVGMGYVPWQVFDRTYALDKAFQCGTIFPELDLEFLYRRCQQ